MFLNVKLVMCIRIDLSPSKKSGSSFDLIKFTLIIILYIKLFAKFWADIFNCLLNVGLSVSIVC